VMGRVKPK